MVVYNDELKFEDELYNYLINLGGTKQWQPLDVHTTEELWDNFRNIVYKLNYDQLPKPLTDQEFAQVKAQLLSQTKTPFEAGRFIYGINGKAQVSIEREDGKVVFLTLFDQDEIGAGNTVYQIAKQIEVPNAIDGNKTRRFDTTLLINGLPIIQIEEKKDSVDANDALNQMHLYQGEHQYSDIYSTVQILVALAPHDAKYMANCIAEDFNPNFAFQWKEKEERLPVVDWKKFCDQFLSIPMAHQMAVNYMILDNTPNHQMLKVMRYYQVYATKAVTNAIKHHDFEVEDQGLGYIWHTTGSGKTISSFKTAFLASRLPNVDKVVFLVDRVALTNQTAEEYQAYDPNRDENNSGIVDSTAHVSDLRKKLRAKRRNQIIVTSIQKMYKLVSSEKFKDSGQNIVFIVDEAHRSTAGNMMKKIKSSIKNSAWVGYTGTPNFDPKNGPTTQSLFGDVLHRYIISEAIADHNVLGFQVDFKTTLDNQELKDKYLPQFLLEKHPNWTANKIENKIYNLSDTDMDDMVASSVYDNNRDHVKLVVHDILTHWNSRSSNGEFNALLTTHVGGAVSTPMAMMYYDEFYRQMSENESLPQLKVAVTFSEKTNNDDNQYQQNMDLSRVIKEYSQRFKVNLDNTKVDEYVEDVVSRLKRTTPDKNYLDIVIVVDQLLTGFDAPQLNTLYVDRTLRGASLIQAYSRTNRIFDDNKPFGRVVNYRWPKHNQKLMNEALAVYSNPDSAEQAKNIGAPIPSDVLADSFPKIEKDLRLTVDQIDKLTDHYRKVPDSEKEQQLLYKTLQHYNQKVIQAKQSDDYQEISNEEFLQHIGLTEDDEARLTGSISGTLKVNLAKKQHTDPINLTLKMEHVNEVVVNFDYLHELLAEFTNKQYTAKTSEDGARVNKLKEQILGYLDRLQDKDPRYVEQIRDFINGDVNKSVDKHPVSANDMKSIIMQLSSNKKQQLFDTFVNEYGLQGFNHLGALLDKLKMHEPGKDDLNNDIEGIVDQSVSYGQEHYHDNGSIAVQQLSPIKYYNTFNKAITKLADEIVRS